MINKFLLSIGLVFLAFSICSLVVLISLLHTPERALGKIPLFQPVICGGGCGGPLPFWISQTTVANGLVIKYEWPKHMDINGSDSISVALTENRTPLSSEPPFPPTPTPIGNVSDRGTTTVSPGSLAVEEDASCKGDPRVCLISNMFGDGYKLSIASAYLVTTSFDAQLIGPVERSTDQPIIEWDWNIFPKSIGQQMINVGINLQWSPTGKGGGTPIVRQLWETPIAIEVNKSFIELGQISVAAVVTAIIGAIFTGFSLPWPWEQRKQVNEKKQKKNRRFCRYCGAENPEDFGFCNRCGKQRTDLAGATISTPLVPSPPKLTGDKQSTVGNTATTQGSSASTSSKEDGK